MDSGGVGYNLMGGSHARADHVWRINRPLLRQVI
jgi:hypothetical protein